ncbi:MAG TPA: response regulator [Acidobacteriaceae bacterium]
MKRILFVDDEADVLDGMRRMLRSVKEGWEFEFVRNGQAALAACQQRRFDAVVSDLRMPGMDGAELLAHIQTRFPDTARIILAGYADVALTTRAVPAAHRALAKTCSQKELKETLERVCALQDVLCNPALRKIVGAIGELPSLSRTYEQLHAAMLEPSTSIAAIARIVEQDVAMSAKVLQLVNSCFFGLAIQVTSLEHAVNYLGFNTIRTMALYSDTFKAFLPGRCVPTNFCDKLQKHSHRVARIAGALPLARAEKEMAVLGALLHDIGSLVLASSMSSQLCEVFTLMAEKSISQAEAEEELLGISHAEIGAYLLGLWGINNTIVEAIAHHHHPTRIPHERLDCASAVYLANLLANELDKHPNDFYGDRLGDVDRQNLTVMGLYHDFMKYRNLAVEGLREEQPKRR